MLKRLNMSYHKKVMKYLKREKELNIFLISDIERFGYDSYFFSVYADINNEDEIEGILLKCFEFIIFYAYDKFNEELFSEFINDSKCEELCGISRSLEKLEPSLDLKRFRKVNIFKLEHVDYLDS